MNNPQSKTPFLSLLLPLLAGILFQYYLQIDIVWSIVFFLSGGLVMLYSFFVPAHKEFGMRWLFGAGLFVFVAGIGIVSTVFSQRQSQFCFSEAKDIYKGRIINTPKGKGRVLAYDTYLPELEKKIVCYVITDRESNGKPLEPGDVFLFESKIQPFRNFAKDSNVDYPTYMHNKGFAGSVYLDYDNLKKNGVFTSLKISALKVRSSILKFYSSLGFSPPEYAIMAALTLGYQDDMDEDMVQAFRITGTVHVLSVSGLHVGLIYAAIAFLLSFLGSTSRFYKLKPLLIILLLWGYAFITGLAPSVVRAGIMLSVFCLSQLFQRRNQGMNALCIAAFFMLLFMPLSFFDIGFQLSFVSVLAILYLHPSLARASKIKNRLVSRLWQLFTLSLAAQLATFPLCLYYFGTFPTYFFITNLLIVPLVSVIVYTLFALLLGQVISYVFSPILDFIILLLKYMIGLLSKLISLFSSLPFSFVENAYISFLELVLIFVAIIGLSLFVKTHRGKMLNLSIASILILVINHFIHIL